MDQKEKQQRSAKPERTKPTVSAMGDDGSLVELVYDPAARRTALAVWSGDGWTIEHRVSAEGQTLVPYSPNNNVIRNRVVLLPSAPEEYRSEEELLREIQAFIHRYVDVHPRFERIASGYVLFTWLYDTFNELPYLRLRGDYGSGKTRFLLTVGALCYKPIFASGASTVSPIFHLLDAFRGTLILDEADFRFSDEKAEIVKILNNGNVKGVPVLRTEVSANREFNPRAFSVFSPKIVATRGYYDDRALESRFITEETGGHRLRSDIPIALPQAYHEEAQALRNKLLLYRFRNFGRTRDVEALVDTALEPRLNQIFAPLMSVVADWRIREDLHQAAMEHNRDILADRGMDVEAQVLECIRRLIARKSEGGISIKGITKLFIERFGSDYDDRVTNRWIGTIVRRGLNLRTRKSHGLFVVPREELPKLERLYERYGLADNTASPKQSDLVFEPVDMGDKGEQGKDTLPSISID